MYAALCARLSRVRNAVPLCTAVTSCSAYARMRDYRCQQRNSAHDIVQVLIIHVLFLRPRAQ